MLATSGAYWLSGQSFENTNPVVTADIA